MKGLVSPLPHMHLLRRMTLSCRCSLVLFAPIKAFGHRALSSHPVLRSTADSDDLYEYTSGKWLWNNALRHAERRRKFDVVELTRLAAAAVDRRVDDVTRLVKLAEGGFNRTFLLSMSDGFQMVARIPYSISEPKNLLVASEVATIDYLRAHGFPVPAVYGYSTDATNAAGTEYIFMQFMRGKNLGDIWYDLGGRARIKVVERLVEMESRLFELDFPAAGSLYYARDLDPCWDRVELPSKERCSERALVIGPDMTLGLWYGRRQKLDVFRGPYRETQEVLAAGARKEIAYLNEHGQPLHPFQRLRRECCDYQRQSHTEYLDLLRSYLLIHPHLIPQGDPSLSRPKLRHPDLQPNNVFVSDDLEITGLIDWQHTTILPLFLQGGIPSTLQNHGDEVSESLDFPTLPEDFDQMEESAQFKQVLLLRQRQLHYHYVKNTMESRSAHAQVLIDPICILRRKLFSRATDPWEGDNVTLKADLIEFTRLWPSVAHPQPGQQAQPCPIEFSEKEQRECSARLAAFQAADDQFRTCLDLVGAGPEGWTPVELYDDVRERAEALLKDTLEYAESDEETREIHEHWIFNDFDETEY